MARYHDTVQIDRINRPCNPVRQDRMVRAIEQTAASSTTAVII